MPPMRRTRARFKGRERTPIFARLHHPRRMIESIECLASAPAEDTAAAFPGDLLGRILVHFLGFGSDRRVEALLPRIAAALVGWENTHVLRRLRALLRNLVVFCTAAPPVPAALRRLRFLFGGGRQRRLGLVVRLRLGLGLRLLLSRKRADDRHRVRRFLRFLERGP